VLLLCLSAEVALAMTSSARAGVEEEGKGCFDVVSGNSVLSVFSGVAVVSLSDPRLPNSSSFGDTSLTSLH